MNAIMAILMAVFGVIITIVLLVSMTEMIEAGVTVKMNARLEHLADDVANAVQHLSSSTIDSAAETFDVDIKGVTIEIDSNRYVTVKLNNVEFTDQFHIAEGITVESSTVSDPSRLCFVKEYDPVSQSPTITMRGYKGSPCDTEYREVDLRYDWVWDFEDWTYIEGELVAGEVNLVTDMPMDRIIDAKFHEYNLSNNIDKYFRLKPGDQSRYFIKFDFFAPINQNTPALENYGEFTLDISPLHAIDTEIFYSNWHIADCTPLIVFNCVKKSDQTLIFNLTYPWWPNITIVNARLIEDFYEWGFYDTRSYYAESITEYPNSTVSMVTFHNFTTPEKTYINITPGDFGPNYFSFGLFVPDDNNVNTHNNISLTLSILPFYSMNVDVRDGAKAVPECTSMDKPCFRRLGSEIMLELEPGTYGLTVEDPAY